MYMAYQTQATVENDAMRRQQLGELRSRRMKRRKLRAPDMVRTDECHPGGHSVFRCLS